MICSWAKQVEVNLSWWVGDEESLGHYAIGGWAGQVYESLGELAEGLLN